MSVLKDLDFMLLCIDPGPKIKEWNESDSFYWIFGSRVMTSRKERKNGVIVKCKTLFTYIFQDVIRVW